jgi:hypothetical protein
MGKDSSKQGVIWIKGFSASEKTTVARKVEFLLNQSENNIIVFDRYESRSIFVNKCWSINDPLSREGEDLSPTERLNGHYRWSIIPYELDDGLVKNGFEVIEISKHSGIPKHNNENRVGVRVKAIQN